MPLVGWSSGTTHVIILSNSHVNGMPLVGWSSGTTHVIILSNSHVKWYAAGRLVKGQLVCRWSVGHQGQLMSLFCLIRYSNMHY